MDRKGAAGVERGPGPNFDISANQARQESHQVTGASGCNHMLRPKPGVEDCPNAGGVRAMSNEGNSSGSACACNHTDINIGYTLLWMVHVVVSVFCVKVN